MKMSTEEAVLSFMDLLDLDEELIDKRLKSIMVRDTYTNKLLTSAIQLLQYKHLINIQENTECSNDEELLFVAKLMQQMTPDKVQPVCKIINIVLSLNASTLVSHSEHFLQQIFSDIPSFDSPCWSSESSKCEETVAHLKLCDSILDTVIKHREKVNLPFLNLPLMNMLYSLNEELRMNFIANTVPKLFEGVAGSNVLDLIWDHVKVSLTLSDEFKQTGLKSLCSLSEYYLPVPDIKGNVLFESEVVFQQEFWELILFGLMSTDAMERKLAMYLFKRAVDCLMVHKKNNFAILSDDGLQFSWDHKNAENSKNRWNLFFILMDSLEEKQANIVLPSLSMFNSLYDIGDCWLNCAFNIGLKHDSAQVRLKCVEQRFLRKLNSQSEAVILLETLNDLNIYDDPNVWDSLKKDLLEFISDVKVFTYIFKAIPLIKWSPVPLYHLSDVLNEFSGDINTLSSNIPQDEMTSLLIEILMIPCNIILIRKAFIVNITRFIGYWCTYLDWKNLADISSMFQLEFSENMADIKYKCNYIFFENICDELEISMDCLYKLMHNTNTYIDFGLTHLDFKMEDVPKFIQLTDEVMAKIQDFVSRQYSNKRECLNDAIFVIKLYNKTINDCYMTSLRIALAKKFKIVLHYILAVMTNDIELEIDEIDSLTSCLNTITLVDAKEILFQLYKVSLLMLTDKSCDLDKAVLSMFVIKNITGNPWILSNYKHELVTLKQVLSLTNNFDNKQSAGRLKNALYERSCEIVYLLIKDEKVVETDLQNLLNYVENVTECGGYGCLKWILKIMNEILPSIKKHELNFDVICFMDRMWKEIDELKSNNQYSICIEEFVNFITQDTLSETADYNNDVKSYCKKIVENGPIKNTPLYYLIRKLSTMTIREPFVFIIFEILLYSPVPRKDQRITENLMNDILDYAKCGLTPFDNEAHFNYEIQYLAISALCNLDPELYDVLITFFMSKVDDTYGHKVRYHGNSQPHRTILTVLQHLLFTMLLKPSLESSRQVVDWCTELLGKLPHQPSVRLCLEWYIALYYCIQNIPLNIDIINSLSSKKVPLTSQLTILYWVVKHRLSIGNCSSSEYEFVMDQLLSHTMGQMFTIRLHAQYYATKLHAINNVTKYSYIIEVIEKTFEENVNDKNFIKLSQDYFANDFDVITDLTPAFIYYFLPKYTAVTINEIFDTEFVMQAIESINKNLENNNCLQSATRKDDKFVFKYKFVRSIDNKIADSDEPMGTIQKKYIPWKNMSDIDVCQVDKKQKTKSELIVVASLIDKLPNLGGMARTSEVFGVKTYVVDSLRHLQDKQFLGLSVSAENWVHIEEVRPGPPLKEYLQKMKDEGYVIVAAEQTSTSCQLQTFKFPKKTLLLLGHEKEGVPCNLLPLMDHCIEIPQQGVVRSLNVHVTAAIFIWEYSQQHIL